MNVGNCDTSPLWLSYISNDIAWTHLKTDDNFWSHMVSSQSTCRSLLNKFQAYTQANTRIYAVMITIRLSICTTPNRSFIYCLERISVTIRSLNVTTCDMRNKTTQRERERITSFNRLQVDSNLFIRETLHFKREEWNKRKNCNAIDRIIQTANSPFRSSVRTKNKLPPLTFMNFVKTFS